MKRQTACFMRFLVACCIFSCLSLPVLGARIAWTYVEGAALYLVEIQNQWGAPVATFETPYTASEVTLLPGTYRLRISVLNKFRKLDAVGVWTPLIVQAGKKIELAGFSPDQFRIGTGDARLRIKGQNFPKNALVRLESGAKNFNLTVQDLREDGIDALIPSWGLEPGTYLVVLQLPDGRRMTRQGFVVEKAPSPEIKDFSPEKFVTGGVLDLSIRGKYLGPRVTVSLNSRVKGQPIPSGVQKDRLRVQIPTERLVPGKYTIEISRPDGARVSESGLTLLAPKTIPRDAGQTGQTNTAGSAETNGQASGLTKPWYLGFALGAASVEINSINLYFYDSMTLGLMFGLRVGAGFAFEAWAFGTGLSIDQSETAGLRDANASLVAFGLDLLWSPEFDFFLNPWVSLGYGLANTTLSIEPELGSVVSKSSLDGMLRASLGLRAVLSDTFFIDAGFRIEQVLYPEGGLWLTGPFVRLGIGFGTDSQASLGTTSSETEAVVTNLASK